MLCIHFSQLNNFTNGNHAKCIPSSHMSKAANANHANARPASQLGKVASHRPDRQGGKESSERHEGLAILPGQGEEGSGMVTPCSQELRRRSLSTISASNSTAAFRHHSNPQWRWSADLSEGGTSHIIILKKSKTRPEPPQRVTSLLRPNTSSKSPSKRHSCPPYSLSSPLVPSPSCPSSSSPVIQTSVITGPSPLGCRMRPKPSSSSSPTAHTARLSLELPSSTVTLGLRPNPATTPNPAPISDSAPPRPKPPHRHHSDSSAFLRSLATPLPVVTDEELSAVQLRPVTYFDGSDDVFREGEEDEEKEREKMVLQGHKVPPSVAAKSDMAKWLAYLISETLPLPALPPAPSPANKGEAVYTMLRKPKPESSHQTEGYSNREPTNIDWQQSGLIDMSSCQSEASRRARDSTPPNKISAAVRVEEERKRRSLPLPVPPRPEIELQGLFMDDNIMERATVSWLKRLSLAQQD